MPNPKFFIVIGASAGGFEAIKKLVSDLPANLDAAVFIVWHMSPDVKGILPQVLNRSETLFAANARDSEPIIAKRIYVAPPDHHLLIEEGVVRVTRGPKENRFRPAIDPLFRSAALTYGPRVIGIVLSGALDDGTAGLWAIKEHGGKAVVQHPYDAEVSAMPESAIRAVEIDHIVPVAEMGALLSRLVDEPIPEQNGAQISPERTEMEVRIAMEDMTQLKNMFTYGEPTLYTCPECHGVLSAFSEGGRVRFRCHTGHAFSANSLLTSISENVEVSLWNAARTVQESVLLLNHMGDHFAEVNQPKIAALYFKKAREAMARAQMVKEIILTHEQLNTDSINEEAIREDASTAAD